MSTFKPFIPDVQVSGKWILALVEGMGSFKKRGYDILSQHNIIDPSPDGWYSQKDWLDAFKEIKETIGSVTLKLIGMRISEKGEMPPHLSIDEVFGSIDAHYHMGHRIKGVQMFDPQTGQMIEGIGNYKMEKTGDNSIRMTISSPYPCEFDLGGTEALATRFKPKGAWHVKVTHNDEMECRRNGGDSCTHDITWK